MFDIGEKISHPMHGAGIIEDITYSSVENKSKPFYLAKMLCGAMTVLIPCEMTETIGVRKIISTADAEKLIESFDGITFDFNENWSQRYRDNMEKIKSGDLYRVSEVVKSLFTRDKTKTLSTGERKLFNTAKNILFSELMLSTGKSSSEIEELLFGNAIK